MQSIQPVNFIEDKIQLLLCMNGYQQWEIQYKNHMGGDVRILRVGYWQFLDEDTICNVQENINVILKPTTFWDDDCGWKTWYNILVTDKEKN